MQSTDWGLAAEYTDNIFLYNSFIEYVTFSQMKALSKLSEHPRSLQTSPTPAVSLTLEIWLASIAEEIDSKKMGFSDSRFPPYCIALIKEAVAKQTYEHW